MLFNPASTISYLQIGLGDFLLVNVAEMNLYDVRGQALKDRGDLSCCLQGWCLQALRESSIWEEGCASAFQSGVGTNCPWSD